MINQSDQFFFKAISINLFNLKLQTDKLKMSTFQHNPQITFSENFPQLHLKAKNSSTSNHSHFRESISHQHADIQNIKKIPSRSAEQVYHESRKILKKSPQIRSPADNQIIFQLTEHNKFLADLVQNISIECFKGIMKQAKIQEVRQRQLLCQQSKPITHIVILLEGKLGICKQQDDFLQGQQGQKTPNEKYNGKSETQFSPSKQNKQKQTRTMGSVTPMDNIFDELSALSCKQIENIRKKNIQLKRKSSIPITAGLFLPLPFSRQQFQEYQIQNFVNPGEEYGAKIRCRTKFHPNTCFAVQKSTLLIIEFNLLAYWIEHSFRTKLGETIQKLKKIPAFSFLEDGKLAECILCMRKEKKKRNDVIYKQGMKSDKLYILSQGQVKLTKEAKLFQENPNEFYVDRRKFINQSSELNRKQDHGKKVQILHYANFKTLYNFRPMKKNIEIGIVSSHHSGNFNFIGQSQLLQKRLRETDAIVSSFQCEYYEIDIRKLEQVLGSKFIEQFYEAMQKSLRKVILYRQKEYADKVNWQNRKNLDYFYYQDNKVKDSPRKYKLEKINNKFNQPQIPKLHIRSPSIGNEGQPQQNDVMKPYYTTFNFHKLIKTQRLNRTRKSSARSERQGKTGNKKRKQSQESQDNTKVKLDAVEERLIGISHTWKPIKKKVIQEIKVMDKISKKRHSININEPLIQQQYFHHVQKEQKRIDREHKIFKLSLGKRTKW